jgi:hypothetical protein
VVTWNHSARRTGSSDFTQEPVTECYSFGDLQPRRPKCPVQGPGDVSGQQLVRIVNEGAILGALLGHPPPQGIGQELLVEPRRKWVVVGHASWSD